MAALFCNRIRFGTTPKPEGNAFQGNRGKGLKGKESLSQPIPPTPLPSLSRGKLGKGEILRVFEHVWDFGHPDLCRQFC